MESVINNAVHISRWRAAPWCQWSMPKVFHWPFDIELDVSELMLKGQCFKDEGVAVQGL